MSLSAGPEDQVLAACLSITRARERAKTFRQLVKELDGQSANRVLDVTRLQRDRRIMMQQIRRLQMRVAHKNYARSRVGSAPRTARSGR